MSLYKNDLLNMRGIFQLEYGIKHESPETRMLYLEQNPALSVLHTTFKEEPTSGLRRWNWKWTEAEEKVAQGQLRQGQTN